MSQDPRQGKIGVGAAGPPAPPRPRKRARSYQHYLDDRPVLVPLVVLALGGACVYATLFSPIMQTLMLGAHPDRSQLKMFNDGVGGMVGMVIGAMAFALAFLLIHGASTGWQRLRRRAAVCTQCGLAETGGSRRFARVPVDGTGWVTVTCPGCGHNWYMQT